MFASTSVVQIEENQSGVHYISVPVCSTMLRTEQSTYVTFFFVYKTSIRRFLRCANNEHQDVEAAGNILSSELNSIRTDALMSVNRTDSLYATLLGAGADRINNARI